MIVILVKEENTKGFYQTCSYNQKLEKEIIEKTEDHSLILKHIVKEFELPNRESIFKFWITNDN